MLKLNFNDFEFEAEVNDDDYKSRFCALCLNEMHSNDLSILFSSNNYHNRCINFWLNLVDEFSFPNLKMTYDAI